MIFSLLERYHISMHVVWIPSWYPEPDRPTSGIFFLEQAEALRRSGLNVGVLHSSFRFLREIDLKSLRSHRYTSSIQWEGELPVCRYQGMFPFPKLQRIKLSLYVGSVQKLMQMYVDRFGRPDIIHAQSGFLAAVGARALSKEYQIPYCVTEHNSSSLTGGWKGAFQQAIFEAYRSADRLFAVSSLVAKSLGEGVELMPNMVDTGFFTPAVRQDPCPFRFLFVGVSNPLKNVDLLLRAFSVVHREDPNTSLEIVGQRGEKAPGVSFFGEATRQEVLEAYRRSHALVLPSRVETFGVVLIEAMACGLPVVATRSGGPEEIVQEQVGALCPPTVDALVESMKSVKTRSFNPDTIRKYAVQNYGEEVFCRRHKFAYELLL
jgi:glycosyltransferase involved in cell wall biosynthesis